MRLVDRLSKLEADAETGGSAAPPADVLARIQARQIERLKQAVTIARTKEPPAPILDGDTPEREQADRAAMDAWAAANPEHPEAQRWLDDQQLAAAMCEVSTLARATIQGDGATVVDEYLAEHQRPGDEAA
jgi:hypothetical protein